MEFEEVLIRQPEENQVGGTKDREDTRMEELEAINRKIEGRRERSLNEKALFGVEDRLQQLEKESGFKGKAKFIQDNYEKQLEDELEDDFGSLKEFTGKKS